MPVTLDLHKICTRKDKGMNTEAMDSINHAQGTIEGVSHLLLAVVESPNQTTKSELLALMRLCDNALDDLENAIQEMEPSK